MTFQVRPRVRPLLPCGEGWQAVRGGGGAGGLIGGGLRGRGEEGGLDLRAALRRVRDMRKEVSIRRHKVSQKLVLRNVE